jgi:hypothetical protein
MDRGAGLRNPDGPSCNTVTSTPTGRTIAGTASGSEFPKHPCLDVLPPFGLVEHQANQLTYFQFVLEFVRNFEG